MAMTTVSAQEANQQFSRLLGEVAEGEEVVITRRGQTGRNADTLSRPADEPPSAKRQSSA